jgi:hypothetical protein
MSPIPLNVDPAKLLSLKHLPPNGGTWSLNLNLYIKSTPYV